MHQTAVNKAPDIPEVVLVCQPAFVAVFSQMIVRESRRPGIKRPLRRFQTGLPGAFPRRLQCRPNGRQISPRVQQPRVTLRYFLQQAGGVRPRQLLHAWRDREPPRPPSGSLVPVAVQRDHVPHIPSGFQHLIGQMHRVAPHVLLVDQASAVSADLHPVPIRPLGRQPGKPRRTDLHRSPIQRSREQHCVSGFLCQKHHRHLQSTGSGQYSVVGGQ